MSKSLCMIIILLPMTVSVLSDQTNRLKRMLQITPANSLLAAQSWTRISLRQLKHVSVGYSGVWGVTARNYVYYRGQTRNKDGFRGISWFNVIGRRVQLDVGTNSVWAVNNQDNVFIRMGITWAKPMGTEWKIIPGKLKHVSVSSKGHVWGVNSAGEIKRRVGASNANKEGDYWKLISGHLKQISVGKSGVWGVKNDGNIYYRRGTYNDVNTDGSSWKLVAGKLNYISSGDGRIWGVNDDRKIYYRTGVVPFFKPAGTGWKQVPGRLEQVEVWIKSAWGRNSLRNVYGRFI